MALSRAPGSRSGGFSVIELMIVVLIIAALAAIALPRFITYQLKSKSAEAKTNLGAIHVAEESYYSEFETYLSASPEPAIVPGSQSVNFDGPGSAFAPLGFDTEGNVYFSYGVAVSSDGTGYSIDSGADIDGDGFVQLWGYTKPDALGVLVPGQVGCDTTVLAPQTIGPCDPNAGQTIF